MPWPPWQCFSAKFLWGFGLSPSIGLSYIYERPIKRSQLKRGHSHVCIDRPPQLVVKNFRNANSTFGTSQSVYKQLVQQIIIRTNHFVIVTRYIKHWRIQGAPPARAPQGSRFFHFDIQILWNVAASGVARPPTRLAPPTGNPGSATVNVHIMYTVILMHAIISVFGISYAYVYEYINPFTTWEPTVSP